MSITRQQDVHKIDVIPPQEGVRDDAIICVTYIDTYTEGGQPTFTRTTKKNFSRYEADGSETDLSNERPAVAQMASLYWT